MHSIKHNIHSFLKPERLEKSLNSVITHIYINHEKFTCMLYLGIFFIYPSKQSLHKLTRTFSYIQCSKVINTLKCNFVIKYLQSMFLSAKAK